MWAIIFCGGVGRREWGCVGGEGLVGKDIAALMRELTAADFTETPSGGLLSDSKFDERFSLNSELHRGKAICSASLRPMPRHTRRWVGGGGVKASATGVVLWGSLSTHLKSPTAINC